MNLHDNCAQRIKGHLSIAVNETRISRIDPPEVRKTRRKFARLRKTSTLCARVPWKGFAILRGAQHVHHEGRGAHPRLILSLPRG